MYEAGITTATFFWVSMGPKQVKSMACAGNGPLADTKAPPSCPESEQEKAGWAMQFKEAEDVGLNLRPKRQGRCAQ